ncbi:elongation factor P maturation arginine rhamnosyltransferase EarP [Neisseria perflava]|uniref:elongation factor P maturation arginine rhamnosyltransferase EarP n=1 Tax=Neisseria perflava TaxID=33053 RepID=UPI0020A0A716|nr:elongation factor P maturation arginine rhamnosyltransferase EarP [Neisseria perflava]MCP1659543.1 putative repeat protein (TIGR03837 family) [Neisseria perflava]
MPTSPSSAPFICWIFCNVIDNYGDIGVSWRLARALQHELGWQVYLWLDDSAALQAISPDLPALPCVHQGIAVRRWRADFAEDLHDSGTPDVVIETFACDLPDNVLNIIRRVSPLWLNWEYLSAEAAHERLHLMPSLQTGGGQKYFWFMGFSEASGGLLREADFLDGLSDNDRATLCQTLQLPPKTAPEWLLFGYRSPMWGHWLRMWQEYGQPVTLLLAGHQIADSLRDDGLIPADALLQNGDRFQTACVTLIKIPFVPQQDFDKLLQLADGCIIRGEDSFVRAQFAAKPFFWHIYPQEENVHLDKLHAFWQRVQAFYPPELFAAHQALSDDLNGGRLLSDKERLQAWTALMNQHAEWRQSVAEWQKFLFAQPSALEKLANFVEDTLK